MVIAIQPFGDLVNFHPHLHALVSDWVLAAKGSFYALPNIPPKQLEVVCRHQVFLMVRREGKIDDALIKKLLR